MKEAIRTYMTGRYGLNEVYRMYEIPKPTLKIHLNSVNVRANDGYKALGRCNVFTDELENELECHILALEEMFFGITITDIRKAAYRLADLNNIKYNFNRNKEMAGKKWFYGFMHRRPKMSLRQPESMSLAMCKGFNRKNVYEFFDLLEKNLDKHKLDATKIYNVDESGFSTVQKKNQKILAKKGKHQVCTIASGERGVNTTMVVCSSAAGHFAAPMIIFKRKRMMTELAEGAPPGCLVKISDSDYINSELSVVWLRKFIGVVKPTKENKILLLLDGHTTHSKNDGAILTAYENGVIILQLPGHTTHRLQLLDVAVFKPLETYYNQAVEKWMTEHPGLAVTKFQVAQILSEA
ncbi:hypothetical protein NQ314_008998 [Rhamnusium bicolor]|uniref:DDE-1 domain-containing protein n=1 Tax=Rhamnusium bicolor TaxID=1586634 RepID=A0AAV8Y5D0_9CUCU|nr:hypothetical protein NQ314_008998 [Rhamnusium bicolor]